MDVKGPDGAVIPHDIVHRTHLGSLNGFLAEVKRSDEVIGLMSVQRTPMTRTGYERLKDELERLKRMERPTIIKAIAEARAHGDLSRERRVPRGAREAGLHRGRASTSWRARSAAPR